MATLTIPNTFTANTTAVSSQVNANFTAITTLINSTKLNNANIATGGLVDANMAANTLTNASIAAGTIRATEIAAGTITTTQISGTAGITGAQLASATVTNAKMAANSVDNTQLVTRSVTPDKRSTAACNQSGTFGGGTFTVSTAATTYVTGSFCRLQSTSGIAGGLTGRPVVLKVICSGSTGSNVQFTNGVDSITVYFYRNTTAAWGSEPSPTQGTLLGSYTLSANGATGTLTPVWEIFDGAPAYNGVTPGTIDNMYSIAVSNTGAHGVSLIGYSLVALEQ